MIGNCYHCQKYTRLNYFGSCPDCQKKEEDWLVHTIRWIKRHGKTTPEKVADKTGFSLTLIYRWLHQKRLKPEWIAHYCPYCGEELNKEFCDCQTLVRKPIRRIRPERFHNPKKSSYFQRKDLIHSHKT